MSFAICIHYNKEHICQNISYVACYGELNQGSLFHIVPLCEFFHLQDTPTIERSK